MVDENPQQQYLQILGAALTPEAIALALAEVPQSGTPNAWYQTSYLAILETFNETHGKADDTSWVKRKCAVYSWIGKIPRCGLCSSTTSWLTGIESAFAGAVLGARGTRLSGGHILYGGAEVSVKEMLGLANHVLNAGGTDNVASCSKLLHFMNPRLFPILDRWVYGALRGAISASQPSGNAYVNYLASLESFLGQDGNRERLEGASRGRFSALRVVDMVLFRQGKGMFARQLNDDSAAVISVR